MRVSVGTLEDARRAVFSVLQGFDHRKRAQVCAGVVESLRAAGVLGAVVDQHYSAAELARLLGRCPEYVSDQARKGAFGPVMRDAKGWLIPASGVNRWLAGLVVTSPAELEARV